MTSGALIALMVAAAGIGAIAARVAASHLPRTTRTREVAATSHPPAAATPAPEPAAPVPDRRFARTGQPPRPACACAIKLTRRPPMGRFVAVAPGGRALARSPVFRLKRTEDDTGPTPPEALRTLVEELSADGWRRTGAGRAPWELRFERGQGAVTRRASPPRA